EAELKGTTSDIIVIGAHYDSVDGSPGADDNASGAAAMLAIARALAREKHEQTIRFVAFVNEEPPYFQTEAMGSWRYAKRCHDRKETITAMLSLESLGYYSDARDSQAYPPPLNALYPSTGNFLGFASTLASAGPPHRFLNAFPKSSKSPAEGSALPPLSA